MIVLEFNINPVAFSIFGIDIAWYGIIIAIGVIAAIFITEKLASLEGIKEGQMTDIALISVFFGIIGARLYYVIFNWSYYSQNPRKILAFREGGLAIYGGIIFGALIIYYYAKKKNFSFLKLADIIVPGVVLAQGIGRWGNFINQEAYGTPTDLPWAIIIDGVKVHPTFFYESLGDIIIFFILYCTFKKKRFDGQILALYMILYGVLRFFVEGLRIDSLMFGSFRVSQLVSLLIIILGFCIFYLKNKDLTNKRNKK